MNIVAFPVNLKQNILLFCNVKELARCAITCKAIRDVVESTINVILTSILTDHFTEFAHKDRWLASHSPLLLLREVLEERIYMLRGFTMHALYVRERNWKRCTDCSRDRSRASLEFLGGFLYAVGTDSVVARGTVERYHPLTDRWNPVANLPNDFTVLCTAVHNKQLYVIGKIGLDQMQMLVLRDENTALEWWDQVELGLPPLAGSAAASVSVGGKLWIFGNTTGDSAEVPATIVTYLCDPSAGTILVGPSMTSIGAVSQAIVAGDNVYVLVGVQNSNQYVWEKCCCEGGPWEVLNCSPLQRQGGGQLAVCGDNILFFSFTSRTCDAFCAATGQWGSGECSARPIVIPHDVPIDRASKSISYPPHILTWT